jgi:hypothetical protein
VESGIKYIRRNFWPSCPDVATLDSLNEALQHWLAEVANVRVHGTTHEVPRVRLAQEPLQAMTMAPYDLSMVSTRRSSKDGFISYGGNRYSVPAGQALSQLTVRETPQGRLEVYAGLECVARHELATGRHQSIVDPAHFDALWQALRERQNPEQILLAGPRLGPDVTEPDVEVRSLEFYEALIRGDA